MRESSQKEDNSNAATSKGMARGEHAKSALDDGGLHNSHEATTTEYNAANATETPSPMSDVALLKKKSLINQRRRMKGENAADSKKPPVGANPESLDERNEWLVIRGSNSTLDTTPESLPSSVASASQSSPSDDETDLVMTTTAAGASFSDADLPSAKSKNLPSNGPNSEVEYREVQSDGIQEVNLKVGPCDDGLDATLETSVHSASSEEAFSSSSTERRDELPTLDAAPETSTTASRSDDALLDAKNRNRQRKWQSDNLEENSAIIDVEHSQEALGEPAVGSFQHGFGPDMGETLDRTIPKEVVSYSNNLGPDPKGQETQEKFQDGSQFDMSTIDTLTSTKSAGAGETELLAHVSLSAETSKSAQGKTTKEEEQNHCENFCVGCRSTFLSDFKPEIVLKVDEETASCGLSDLTSPSHHFTSDTQQMEPPENFNSRAGNCAAKEPMEQSETSHLETADGGDEPNNLLPDAKSAQAQSRGYHAASDTVLIIIVDEPASEPNEDFVADTTVAAQCGSTASGTLATNMSDGDGRTRYFLLDAESPQGQSHSDHAKLLGSVLDELPSIPIEEFVAETVAAQCGSIASETLATNMSDGGDGPNNFLLGAERAQDQSHCDHAKLLGAVMDELISTSKEDFVAEETVAAQCGSIASGTLATNMSDGDDEPSNNILLDAPSRCNHAKLLGAVLDELLSSKPKEHFVPESVTAQCGRSTACDGTLATSMTQDAVVVTPTTEHVSSLNVIMVQQDGSLPVYNASDVSLLDDDNVTHLEVEAANQLEADNVTHDELETDSLTTLTQSEVESAHEREKTKATQPSKKLSPPKVIYLLHQFMEDEMQQHQFMEDEMLQQEEIIESRQEGQGMPDDGGWVPEREIGRSKSARLLSVERETPKRTTKQIGRAQRGIYRSKSEKILRRAESTPKPTTGPTQHGTTPRPQKTRPESPPKRGTLRCKSEKPNPRTEPTRKQAPRGPRPKNVVSRSTLEGRAAPRQTRSMRPGLFWFARPAKKSADTGMQHFPPSDHHTEQEGPHPSCVEIPDIIAAMEPSTLQHAVSRQFPERQCCRSRSSGVSSAVPEFSPPSFFYTYVPPQEPQFYSSPQNEPCDMSPQDQNYDLPPPDQQLHSPPPDQQCEESPQDHNYDVPPQVVQFYVPPPQDQQQCDVPPQDHTTMGEF